MKRELSDGRLIDLTQEELVAREEVRTEYVNNEYKRLRSTEYASVSDQLDMLYWDMINNTTTFIDHRTAIKNKYKKP